MLLMLLIRLLLIFDVFLFFGWQNDDRFVTCLKMVQIPMQEDNRIWANMRSMNIHFDKFLSNPCAIYVYVCPVNYVIRKTKRMKVNEKYNVFNEFFVKAPSLSEYWRLAQFENKNAFSNYPTRQISFFEALKT